LGFAYALKNEMVVLASVLIFILGCVITGIELYFSVTPYIGSIILIIAFLMLMFDKIPSSRNARNYVRDKAEHIRKGASAMGSKAASAAGSLKRGIEKTSTAVDKFKRSPFSETTEWINKYKNK
jgi:hypothetical protein